MASIVESGISLSFPDNHFFRFEDCEVYNRKLKAFSFKEVDVCWYQKSKDLYWFIELKDYSRDFEAFEKIEDRVSNILQKAINSLSMFLSRKHDYELGKELKTCFNPKPEEKTKLILIAIIHTSSSTVTHVPLMNDRFKQKFRAYADLFSIDLFAIIDHNQAKKVIKDFEVT
jgi:hypothetical protein